MKKSRRQKAQEDHAAFLKAIGYKATGKNYRSPMPDYSDSFNRVLAPTSDRIVYGPSAPKEKPEGAKTFTVAPAFNKGGYQLITSTNIKDIGK